MEIDQEILTAKLKQALSRIGLTVVQAAVRSTRDELGKVEESLTLARQILSAPLPDNHDPDDQRKR